MNILVTGTRQPFALDLIRKFGRAGGHRIVAADTFDKSPGNHSTYVSARYEIPSPRFETAGFLDQVEKIIRDEDIELYVPAFEEVFYVARHAERFEGLCRVFASSFENLARLHDKSAFVDLAASLGLRVPRTVTATSQAELIEAIEGFDRYMARAAFSRGGAQLLTNHGPLAGVVEPSDCEPTRDNPFLVQAFIEGEDICTFSIAQEGELTAHLTYEHPVEMEHAGGMTFETIEEPRTVSLVHRIVSAIGYTGHIGFDFLQTESGDLYVVECNPRPTPGLMMVPDDVYVSAVLEPVPDPVPVAVPGIRRKISLAVVREMFNDITNAPKYLKELFARDSKDAFVAVDDLTPAFYQLLTWGQIAEYRKHAGEDRDERVDLIHAFSYDMAWNGEKI